MADHLSSLIKNQDRFTAQAQKNLKHTQIKMKERYDKNTKLIDFGVGTLVYVKNQYRLQKGTSKKLQGLYQGPFMVTDRPTKHTATLRRLSDGKTLKNNVHLERLKLVNAAGPQKLVHNYLPSEERNHKLMTQRSMPTRAISASVTAHREWHIPPEVAAP